MIKVNANTTLEEAKAMVLKTMREDLNNPTWAKILSEPKAELAKFINLVAEYHIAEFREKNMPRGFRKLHII